MTPTEPFIIRLHESDNVVIARMDLAAGTAILQEKITCLDPIAYGHKVATAGIEKGQAVKKYGQIIGSRHVIFSCGIAVPTARSIRAITTLSDACRRMINGLAVDMVSFLLSFLSATDARFVSSHQGFDLLAGAPVEISWKTVL